MGGEGLESILGATLGDPDSRIRDKAVCALEEIGGEGAIAAIADQSRGWIRAEGDFDLAEIIHRALNTAS